MSPKVWRIRGLPRSITYEKLLDALGLDAEQDEKLPISIAASSEHFACATVTMDTRPVPQGMRGCSVDNDFLGITPLYDADDAAIDIIVVPGLAAHPIGSFRSCKGNKVWIRDFLPRDFPQARVLLYGYESKLLDSSQKVSISDLAKALLDRVTTFRRNTFRQKNPIIFIAHSLGGLIVKKSLTIAASSTDVLDISEFFQACHGLVLFGVPNTGLRNKRLMSMIKGQANAQLIRDLQVDKDTEASPYLQDLAQAFTNLHRNTPDLRIITYYERKLSPMAEQQTDQSWKRTGPRCLMVTQASASRVGSKDDFYNSYSIDSDHSGLVKFDNAEDSAYLSVKTRIEPWITHAISEDVLSEGDKDCLQSLAFADMDSRRKDAKRAAGTTCQWLLDHRGYQAWLSRRCGFLWIQGKPGAGKTTLMEFLIRTYKDNPGPRIERRIQLDFFIHGRGTPLQCSEEGLYRSLLHQLLSKVALVRPKFRAEYKKREAERGHYGKEWTWHLKDLRDYFSDAVEEASKKQHIDIFIDALDESGEESAYQLLADFSDLFDKLSALNLPGHICFSCRHYPVQAPKNGIKICVEDENDADILHFVQNRLRDKILNAGDNDRQRLSGIWSDIASSISSNSHGVFQWADIAVSLCIKEHQKGTGLKKFQEKLRELPSELGDIYKYIFENVIGKADYESSLHLFQWVCLAERPLTLSELRYALNSDKELEDDSVPGYEDLNDFIEDDDQMKRQVSNLSGSLLECKVEGRGRIVQPIHQSVNDFMIREGFGYLSTEGHNHVLSKSYDRLAKSCLNYICYIAESRIAKELQKMSRGRRDQYRCHRFNIFFPSEPRFPFAAYASKYWLEHAQKAEARHCPQKYILEQISWPSPTITDSWIMMYRVLHKHDDKEPANGTTILHLAAQYHLSSIIANIPSLPNIVDTTDEAGNTPLHYAARSGSADIIRRLVDAGAQIDALNRDESTPLIHAATRDQHEIIKLLLQYGARVNGTGHDRDPPLYAAAEKGNLKSARSLLTAGADINAQGGYYGNALQVVSVQGRERIVELLLASGADVNAQGGDYGTALQAASAEGYERVVELLLASSTDVDAQGGKYSNALQVASAQGREKIVELLLASGADVNAQGGNYGTALQAASAQGYERVVELLLASGADVNAQGGYYGNALYAASYRGNEKVVELLLASGADVNAQGGDYGNALQAASAEGHKKVVKLLLASGADVNAQGGNYGNALRAASYEGNEEVVELLLASDADVDAQGGKYGNALRASVYGNSLAVFKLLSKAGSNLSASDPYGRTILHGRLGQNMLFILQKVATSVCLTASSSVDRTGRSILHYHATGKDNEVLRWALSVTSNVNMLDDHQWTPLHWAAYFGQEEHVKLLLDADADTGIQDWQGWLPHHVAIFAGHEAIADVLGSGNEESSILAGKEVHRRCWYCEHVRNLPDDSSTGIEADTRPLGVAYSLQPLRYMYLFRTLLSVH